MALEETIRPELPCAYNGRALDRQTATELFGRLIHVLGIVWQSRTEVQAPPGRLSGGHHSAPMVG